MFNVRNQTKIPYLMRRYNDDPIDKSQDSNYILRGHFAGDSYPSCILAQDHSLIIIATYEEI